MQLCEKYTNNPSELTHCDWFIRLLPELYSSRNVYHIVIHYTHFKEQSHINNDRLFPRALNFFPSPRMRSHAQPHIQKASPPSPYTDYALTRSCIGCNRSLPEVGYPKSAWRQTKKLCCVCRAISVMTETHRNWEQEANEDWDGEEDVNLEDYDLDYGWYRGEDYACYDSNYRSLDRENEVVVHSHSH